ncbi:MAG: sporulation protein [Xanthomonadaceae bacterium]|nr:sporulation protein [Xanthomonadaceae bacterium]
MVAKRGKSQARRNTGRDGGLPGWAWLVLGIVLTVAVVLAAPRLLRSGAGDGFFRPKPNPDAQPAPTRGGDDAIAPDDGAAPHATPDKPTDKPKPTQYDFYTMLPANEVAMSDAELAATARAEAARRALAQRAATATAHDTDAGMTTPPDTGSPAVQAPASITTVAPAAPGPAVAPGKGNDTPYLLQAGAFGASGDAEAIKAKVALLGLSARVESAAINGKTVYRVRMGPYGSASELAEAKRKLATGGLPAMAIRVR